MKTNYKVAIALVAGVAIGGAAIQGLHAQGKAKAYTVTELETLDAKAAADVAPRIAKAQVGAGGHNFRTGGGKVTGMEGPPPPSVSRSPNGIALRKHRHSSSQSPGPISDRIVTRRSRPYADMRWKNGTNKLQRGRLALKAEAASVGGLFQFVRL